MAKRNYIKALRRAKSKKFFYTSFAAFIPTALILFTINVGFIGTDIPWCMIPIGIWSASLFIHRLLLFKRPQKTIFSNDFLEYQTEKEMRLIEFEDEMDEIEAEKLDLKTLELEQLRPNFRREENELV
jgi:hypothetical protein